jgi:hypothetical protein
MYIIRVLTAQACTAAVMVTSRGFLSGASPYTTSLIRVRFYCAIGQKEFMRKRKKKNQKKEKYIIINRSG